MPLLLFKKNDKERKSIMKNETKAKEPRAPKLIEAIITFVGLVIIMSLGIIKFKVDPHIPMFIGVIFAALMSLRLGYKWEAIEEMMITGISRAMQAILILAIVGMLVGTWILSGTIPTMIYYGLKLLSPSVFLIATVLICSVTSLATGTSWGTMGTMGLALVGIATGLGVPIGPTAGAIISGAYFGDKLSPLSDTTNLAPAMAGTDVFSHVKFMMKATIVAYVISLGFFGVYGFIHASSGQADTSQLDIIMRGLEDSFNINPILLLPPLVVILAIALKVPAIPGITLGVIVAAVMAPIFQQDVPIFSSDGELLHNGVMFGDIINSSMNGFSFFSGIDALDALLTKGGLMGMAFSILMTIIAMMFGGIMEGTGQLAVIINAITKYVKSGPALVGVTELTCIASNVTMPEQYISILIPGRMYAPAYRKSGLHPVVLSNALESAGTVTSPLVPWNTCAIYIKTTLNISSTLVYAPWAIFNIAMPIIAFLLAFVGITVKKMTSDEQKLADEGELVKL